MPLLKRNKRHLVLLVFFGHHKPFNTFNQLSFCPRLKLFCNTRLFGFLRPSPSAPASGSAKEGKDEGKQDDGTKAEGLPKGLPLVSSLVH